MHLPQHKSLEPLAGPPSTGVREPSFADAIAAIERSDQPPQRRQHSLCSLKQLTKWLGRPAEAIPARWSAILHQVKALHHKQLGITAKTLANHKANVKAALRYFRKEHDLVQHGVALTPAWQKFSDTIGPETRRGLYSVMRYCSACSIVPTSVNGSVFDEYWKHRIATSARVSDNTQRRYMTRLWNNAAKQVTYCRVQILVLPPPKGMAHPPWEDFPERFRQQTDDYFAGLAKPHRTWTGKRIRPCSPGTIKTRQREFIAVARMAVRIGVPIKNLTSLAAFLDPDVVERVIDAYWKKNGDEPTTSTIDLGWKFLRMARETGCLDKAAIERLDEIRVALEDHRHGGMTPKNLRLIRQVLTPGVWNEVISLPDVLMKQARMANDYAPIKAAATAQLAVAIAILSFAPVRLGNLASIKLGENLTKPGGIDGPYWLVFPHYDVKNRVDLNFKFDQPVTDLIEEYIQDFLPALLRRSNAPLLFPGEDDKPKNTLLFGQQITARIQKATGLRVTPHQFRHAAAAIYLKHRPGDYETVRRFLGHRDIQTTTRFYCGLQTMQATEQFGKIVREHVAFDARA